MASMAVAAVTPCIRVFAVGCSAEALKVLRRLGRDELVPFAPATASVSQSTVDVTSDVTSFVWGGQRNRRVRPMYRITFPRWAAGANACDHSPRPESQLMGFRVPHDRS